METIIHSESSHFNDMYGVNTSVTLLPRIFWQSIALFVDVCGPVPKLVIRRKLKILSVGRRLMFSTTRRILRCH